MRNIWSVNKPVLLQRSHPDGSRQSEPGGSTMRRVATAFVLTGLGLALLAGPAFAHHAFAGQYDKDTPIQLTGVVTKIEWMNPHARFYVDVKDESGNVTNWKDRKSTRLNSSHQIISYAVFCLKKKKIKK